MEVRYRYAEATNQREFEPPVHTRGHEAPSAGAARGATPAAPRGRTDNHARHPAAAEHAGRHDHQEAQEQRPREDSSQRRAAHDERGGGGYAPSKQIEME